MESRSTIKSIQYLRGLAALMVVFFHFRYYLNDISNNKDLGDILFSNGAFGVDLFFIISGFIICYATERKEKSPLISYTLKRFFRIYPLLIVSLVIFYFLFGSDDKPVLKSMLPIHADYSEQGPFFGYNLLSPVWTITYEICFYTVFLIGLAMSQKYRKYITIFLLLSSFIILQLFINKHISLSAYTNYDYTNNPIIKPAMALLSSPMIIEFIYGIILYILYNSLPSISEENKKYITPVVLFFIFLSITLIFSNSFYGHGPTKWGFPSLILVSSLLIYEKMHGFPNSKTLLFLGNISFSLYLTHVIIIKIIRKYDFNFGLENFPAFLFSVGLSITIASIFYYSIESKSISACRLLLEKIQKKPTHLNTLRT